ncbi:MAG TPA: ABC transporter permease [Vicinamibacterales bacterium]|nr:ABC transporter permease [Vicinamibacterales bacterium]
MANLRLAFRTLFKTPFVTIVAIVSLALGIGANAAIFSLFDQMLLRPLPVQNPEQLVNLSAPGPKPGSNTCNNQGPCADVFSYPMYRDLERVQTAFTGIAAHRSFGANLAMRGQTINGDGMLVSGNYFPLLGVQPALGRLFTPEDDKTPGAHLVVVLSEAYWRTRFESNPNVLNETLVVNGQAMTIVGVTPRGFEATSLGSRPHVYVPLTMRGLMQPGFVLPLPNRNGFENRRNYWAYVFARLKPGRTIEQAKVAINGPYRSILNEVEAPLQQGMSEQTMTRFKAREVVLTEGYRGQSSLHEEAQTPLLLLMGVTGFVLLIACANVANLLLARAAGRAGEMAVRLSIGANRRQLITQLLGESVLLAMMGGVVGLLVSRWTLDLVASLLPPEAATTIDFFLDRMALIWAGALALGTGLLFGLFPAIHSTRPDLVSTLKDQAGQKGASRAAARFRTSLATAQIALSMALLVAAGLFTRSLINVSRIDLGIAVDNVATFAISPQLNSYTPERTLSLFERLEDELAGLPGVTSVTASTVALVSGNNWGNSVRVQGFDAGPDTNTDSSFTLIGPGYFRTLGIPLLAGREFSRGDGPGAAKVVIVNEAFAKKFNLGRDAVGKRMTNRTVEDAPQLDIEIIGLVQNAKYSEVKGEIPPVFFLPYRQDERLGFINFYVKTAGDPMLMLSTITGVVARLDPNLPVEGLKTLPQQVRENVFLDRMITTLSAAFAILATVLAAVGLYGVLAYTVAQRTREIGLRMALGADGGRVRGMVLRQVAWMTLIGGLLGLAGAVGLGQLAQSLLYQLNGYDPMVLATSMVLLAIVAMGAGLIPAMRASRIDPMVALRYE